MTADAARPTPAVLQAWLRTLWNVAPALWPMGVEATPFLSAEGLHLPVGHGDPRVTLAAAAHAGAHLVYSRPGADATGLRATARTLAGLLEDARIEWLAGRELPGLRRLWSSLHTVQPSDGNDAEMLMRRLARALADAQYTDPHPWIAKARRLCFLDPAQQVLRLRQFSGVRHVASLLGNDLGQMRLPLNAGHARPWPPYRDDNTWLWQHDAPPEPMAAKVAGGEGPAAGAAAQSTQDTVHAYPEWDQRIARERPAWVTVTERDAPRAARAENAAPAAAAQVCRSLAQAARARSAGDPRWLPRQSEGERLDLGALVRSCIAKRTAGGFDPRVHQRRQRGPDRADVLLMLDTSASSADVLPGSTGTVLDLTQAAARLCCDALHGAGHRCAVQAFSSAGRSAVTVQRVKDFDGPFAAAAVARLAALRSGQSTRLGAAIRHGTAALCREGTGRTRHLALLTDGDAHDIDVHEAGYLAADARRAVRDAQRHGVVVSCFCLQAADRAALSRIFGRGRHHTVRSPADLPAALGGLWR